MPTDTPIEYAIISIDRNGAEYVNGFRTLPPSKFDRLDAKKRADLRPVTRTADDIDPATHRPGEPVTTIDSDAVTIHSPAVDLTQRERGEMQAKKATALLAAKIKVGVERAGILQAIADKVIPANTPLPEYPA